MPRTAPHLVPPARARQLLTGRRLATLATLAACGLAACASAQARSTPFFGALMPMAGKPGSVTCPRGWMQAQGQLLPIQAYGALFSVLGAAYGGDGVNTFALPDLRGRVAVGVGQGPGLTPLVRGERGGGTHVALAAAHLPPHGLMAATTAVATHTTPGAGRALAQARNAGMYASSGTAVTLGQSGTTGGGAAVPTMSPYLAIVWCIAVQDGQLPPSP